MLFPTEVIFSGNERGKSITIANTGDATGIFELSWFDSKMTPEGTVQRLEEQPTWSLQPHIRFSPRRVELKPGQNQTVKIALRRTTKVTLGEYFSHLRVLTLNDNVDSQPNETTDTITIKARTAISIPVIWRNGPLRPSATFEDIQFDKTSNGISLMVVRTGHLSTRGRLKVQLLSKDSSPLDISEPVHTVIYPNIESKAVSIPLTTNLQKLETGTWIMIRYAHGDGNKQQLIAEQRIDVRSLLN